MPLRSFSISAGVAEAVEHDVGALPGERARDAEADAGGRSGDERDFSFEHVGILSGSVRYWRSAFGQLSLIQRARLSSLTSPAASERIMAVACAWSGRKSNPVLAQERR